MWLTDAQSKSHSGIYLTHHHLTDGLVDLSRNWGEPSLPYFLSSATTKYQHETNKSDHVIWYQVGLTSFGAFFMMLGVIMFFDGALCALGNVSPFYHYFYLVIKR